MKKRTVKQNPPKKTAPRREAPQAPQAPRRPRFPFLARLFSRALTLVLAILLAAVFYLAVIMGQPSAEVLEKAVKEQEMQPLLSAQPAYQTQSAQQMVELLGHFPAPALTLGDSAGLQFLSGKAYDLAYEGGFARVLEIAYQSPAGQAVTLKSIYPARAFELLGRENLKLETLVQSALGGQNAVVMTGPSGTRLHAQGPEALYALSGPGLDAAQLGDLARHTQLTHPS